LPAPARLVEDLEPLVDEQRLLVWTTDEAEAAMLRDVGLAQGLPVLDGRDGFSLALTNGGASKIDAYLDRSIELDRVVAADGSEEIVAEVTLTNNAPSEGLPDYVIGNAFDLPDGTSRLFLVGYSSEPISTVTFDGEEVQVEQRTELGWHTASHFVTLDPGQRVVVTYRFPSRDTDDPIVTRVQPIAAR
jgi:hypothetical protein